MPATSPLISIRSNEADAVIQRVLPALAALSVLAACTGEQSVLDPQGPHARQTAAIAWILFGGGALIFALVAALAASAIFGPRRWRGRLGGKGIVVAGGIVFPVVTLTALLVYTFIAAGNLGGAAHPAPLRIEVVGEMWWWRVHYLGADGRPQMISANEIRIPVGRPVELSLRSADVIHSFWLPSLAGKLDMIPGRTNVLRITADKAGVFRGQCAEYCGAQHAKMALLVVALAPPQFDAWLASQMEPGREPGTENDARGQSLFVAHCGACHTVRGTPAKGELGPDLTHVGGRLSLAAGIRPNNAGTLAGWIASSQHLKPGNRMPSFDVFAGDELTALAGYLEGLR
jgi:cytochrome c oxidase subunit 2